jgi:hypothetical protein
MGPESVEQQKRLILGADGPKADKIRFVRPAQPAKSLEDIRQRDLRRRAGQAIAAPLAATRTHQAGTHELVDDQLKAATTDGETSLDRFPLDEHAAWCPGEHDKDGSRYENSLIQFKHFAASTRSSDMIVCADGSGGNTYEHVL